MRDSSFQRITIITTIVIGLLALFIVPAGGHPALLNQLSEFKTRALEERYSPAEQDEMSFLKCIEDNLRAIPDGSSLWIQSEDGYLIQRIADISYPRLTLNDSAQEFGLTVDSTEKSIGEVQFTFECSGKSFQVVSFD